jgi:hypothetical protein
MQRQRFCDMPLSSTTVNGTPQDGGSSLGNNPLPNSGNSAQPSKNNCPPSAGGLGGRGGQGRRYSTVRCAPCEGLHQACFMRQTGGPCDRCRTADRKCDPLLIRERGVKKGTKPKKKKKRERSTSIVQADDKEEAEDYEEEKEEEGWKGSRDDNEEKDKVEGSGRTRETSSSSAAIKE